MSEVTNLPVRHVIGESSVRMLYALLEVVVAETGPDSAEGLLIILPTDEGAQLIAPDEMSNDRVVALLKEVLANEATR